MNCAAQKSIRKTCDDCKTLIYLYREYTGCSVLLSHDYQRDPGPILLRRLRKTKLTHNLNPFIYSNRGLFCSYCTENCLRFDMISCVKVVKIQNDCVNFTFCVNLLYF